MLAAEINELYVLSMEWDRVPTRKTQFGVNCNGCSALLQGFKISFKRFFLQQNLVIFQWGNLILLLLSSHKSLSEIVKSLEILHTSKWKCHLYNNYKKSHYKIFLFFLQCSDTHCQNLCFKRPFLFYPCIRLASHVKVVMCWCRCFFNRNLYNREVNFGKAVVWSTL